MRRIKILSLFLAFCILFTGCNYVNLPQTEDIAHSVTAIDVGQAACTLVESGGEFALIDAGEYGTDTDIVAYLNSRNVDKIKLLVLTHFHYDHTSDALNVIRNFDIDTIVIPALTKENIPDSYLYKSIIEDGQNGYYNLEFAVKDKVFTVGNGEIKILRDTINHKDINNTSVVLSYTQGDFVYVNMGDVESVCDDIIMDGMPKDITLFAASHHGSKDANSRDLLERLSPKAVVISRGEDNDYKHPHTAFLNRLTALKIPYYITYEKGNIIYDIVNGGFIFE